MVNLTRYKLLIEPFLNINTVRILVSIIRILIVHLKSRVFRILKQGFEDLYNYDRERATHNEYMI